MDNAKDNKTLNGIIFMGIRTLLQIVSIVLAFLLLYSNNVNLYLAGFIGIFIANIFFAFVPHFFIKKISLGRATVMNTLAQILFVIICLIIISVSGDSNEEALGWALGLSLFAFFFIVPIYFICNLLVDLIMIKAIRKN